MPILEHDCGLFRSIVNTVVKGLIGIPTLFEIEQYTIIFMVFFSRGLWCEYYVGKMRDKIKEYSRLYAKPGQQSTLQIREG